MFVLLTCFYVKKKNESGPIFITLNQVMLTKLADQYTREQYWRVDYTKNYIHLVWHKGGHKNAVSSQPVMLWRL